MSELLAVPWATVLPFVAIIIVYVGEKLQQWAMIRALKEVALKPLPGTGQGPGASAVPLPSPPAKTEPSPAPAKPAPAQEPKGPFDDAPAWFKGALHEIGFHETGNNGGLDRYIGLAHCGQNGDPWCAIFANAMLEQAGIPGTRSAASQSFRTHPNFVQLSGPALGAVAVFWRGSQSSGLGHVGFYRGEDASRVWTLGGNENDMVQIEALPKSSGSFGLIGYFWPKSVPLPATAPVMMPAGSPASLKTDPSGRPASVASAAQGVFTDIVATMFTGQQSAYGVAIKDDAYGVALPFHFPAGERPKVRVTGKKSGKSIECEIVDVGPWNTRDPYWETASRPQAESGTDLTGRHTNKAGIDLTMAAAEALQIDGKGLVDWEFVQSPAPEPKVS